MHVIHLAAILFSLYIAVNIMKLNYFNVIILQYILSGLVSIIIYKNENRTLITSLMLGCFFIIYSTSIYLFIIIMYTYYVSRTLSI